MFLVGGMVYGALTETKETAMMVFLVSMAFVALMKAFQKKQGVKATYLCGVALTLAALCWPYVIVLLLPCTFFLLIPLEAFSRRTVAAMLLGALTPLWLYLPFALVANIGILAPYNIINVPVIQWPEILMPFFDYHDLNVLHTVTYGLLLIALVILSGHCVSYRFNGKLFVRIQRGIYISMAWIMAAMIVILPSYAGFMLPLMAAFMGPVVAQLTSEE